MKQFTQSIVFAKPLFFFILLIIIFRFTVFPDYTIDL